ncbi:MAG TPA: hypothetical protein VIH61_02520 [Waddliaceae bacterium]
MNSKNWVHGNKAGFEEYQDTHSFLPPRGDNMEGIWPLTRHSGNSIYRK